jgi:hypothetical protein
MYKDQLEKGGETSGTEIHHKICIKMSFRRGIRDEVKESKNSVNIRYCVC